MSIFKNKRFNFDFAGVDVKGSVEWMLIQSNGLKNMLSTPTEVPEGQIELDLKSRAGKQARMMKHIHQQSFMKVCHFRNRNLFKLIYMVDGYLQMLEVKNPIGIFSFARSMLELNAHIYEVYSRLSDAADQTRDWRTRGEMFHKTINRFRLGTSNPYAKELLKETGVSKSISDPVHIHKSIEKLAEIEEFSNLMERYGFLCDFVHHNRSSQAILAGELLKKTSAKFGGSTMLFPNGEKRDISRYQFPPKSVIDESFDYVTLDFTKDFAGAYIAIQAIPDSPYTMDELEAVTGDRLGVQQISTPGKSHLVRSFKAPRNALCPCGSGKKYKKCCLRR